jgi:hypothetical protein
VIASTFIDMGSSVEVTSVWPFRAGCGDLPTAAEVRPLGAVTARPEPGVVPIPLDRIMGTVARCCDFDRCFQVLRSHLEERLDAVRRRWPDGVFPPITVQRIGDGYFVVDGHHRVALAHELGQAAIDARVTAVLVEP